VSHDATLFAFNDRAQAKLTRIGRRQIAVVRIDDVLRDPESVAALGLAQPYAEDRGNLYPGLRVAMPESFSIALRSWLNPILQRNGILQDGQVIHRDSSYFSVVTTPSRGLLPIQRIPHYDSTDPRLLAIVIYLCDARFAGTSFYRHRRTGYEEITEATRENYQIALDHDMRLHGPPPREYMNGDNRLFEVIFSNELEFNSAIVYPGRVLHAGNIEKHFDGPRDKSAWRLTITALLQWA
jgi:hypothetical protein